MSNRIDTDELLIDLQRVGDTIEGTPKISDYRKEGEYSPKTLRNRFGSWNDALKKAGYQPNVRWKVNKQDLLANLKEIAEELGKPPTTTEYNSRGNFNTQTFKNKFGSWNEALREAGYDPNLRKDITRKELIDDLQRVGNSVGDTPTISDYSETGKYSPKTLRNRFGSWNEALQEAGYQLNKFVPQEDLLTDLERVHNLLEEVPTCKDYRKHGKYSVGLISDRFGSWNAGLEAAGYHPNSQYSIPREDLLDDLKQVGDSLGNSPTMIEYNTSGTYSTGPFYNYFDSWADALIAAGFEPNYRSDISNERLLTDLRRVAELLDTTPEMTEYQSHGKYSPSPLVSSFGSWNEALEAAGYEPNIRQYIPDEDLLSDIRRVGDLIRSTPRMSDYEIYGNFGSATVSRRFETWNDAIQKAGFQPNRHQNIPRDEALSELQRVANILDGTPTAQEFRKHGDYSVKYIEYKFGSWNDALQAANLPLNSNIPSDDLLSDLRESHDCDLAPPRWKHPHVGKYHSATIRQKTGGWWAACVKAGYKPLARRPLCPNAIHQYHQTAIDLPDAEMVFYGLLFQFTGLTPSIAAHFNADWVADRRDRCIVRVPREYTTTGNSWVFLVPETWENPCTGAEEPTHLPALIDRFTTLYDEIPMEAAALRRVPLQIAKNANLGNFRRIIDHSTLGEVPEVRPQDLRTTLGINLARMGEGPETIKQQVGIEQTGWTAEVKDFFLWLDENESHQS